MGKDDPKHIPFVGMDADYIGRSAWDFYSWGHIALGIALCLLLSLLITVPEALGGQALISWWLIMVLVLIILFIWECIENVILWGLGWKFEDRQDSLVNFLWDIIFGAIGAGSMWLSAWIIFDVLGALGRYFYIFSAIIFGLVIVAYLIGYSMYKSKNKQ